MVAPECMNAAEIAADEQRFRAARHGAYAAARHH
jgi:hypothetical protein